MLSAHVQSHDQRSKLVLRAKVAYSSDDNPAKYHEQVNSGSPPPRGGVWLASPSPVSLFHHINHLECCAHVPSRYRVACGDMCPLVCLQAIRDRGDLLNFQDKEGKSKDLPLYGLSVFDTLVQVRDGVT